MNSSVPSNDPLEDDPHAADTPATRSTSSELDASAQAPYLGTPVVEHSGAGAKLPQLTIDAIRSEVSQMWLPTLLLVATCISTFVAGAMSWEPMSLFFMDGGPSMPFGMLFSEAGQMDARRIMLRDGGQGFVYMACVIAILFAHEMGHYIATRIYKIPSSPPFFIPFPIAPLGTMGAVIAMKGQQANRKEIFDIGIAGPLAGLVLAVPIACYGIANLDIGTPGTGGYRYHLPLLIQWIYQWMHPGSPIVREVYSSQLNATFMAGWVGFLITGLNMMPLSQLDGGHVTYTLFGSFSRWIARAFVVTALAYMILTKTLIWTLMLILVFVIGLYHPPTSDDSVPLGKARIILGVLSLLIPILCFPPKGLVPIGGF